MEQEEKHIGYLKYSGKSVEGGFLDTRKSAEALLGFDEILRFFLIEEDSRLKEVNFEIPVRIRKGSWEAVIPEIIDKLFSPTGIGATTLTIYATASAKKAAEDGVFNIGAAKDIKATFRYALKATQWVIKIGSHIGTLSKKKFDNVKIRQTGKESIIDIPNSHGEILSVPKKYFDIYTKCPEKIFSKNAGIIEQERILEFGVYEDGVEKKVSITEKEKLIFFTKSEDEDILFPELKHGQNVELEGSITRGNEKTNTIGFEYRGHILTCKPKDGNIAVFKNKIISQLDNHFFPPVKIVGIIDRTDENHLFKNSRPQVIFNDIIPLEKPENKKSLFD